MNGNMGNMMKQIQKMQKEMMKMQEELQQKTVVASSGGGMIRVEVSGKKELVSLNIDPEAVDLADLEMLQDMIMAAVNEGLRKVEEMMTAEMQKLTGGLNLPPGLL
ncbi:MAG: YbaB/EbfC family nucleoid-associated protein [Dethiobacter sp.]|jgi:DNA-binding YbaB/EbfC family protein|nr:YbaB/EbfC family nucleoid-associated protein [Dethiobacter sp.]MBS3899036.1 YbaB/EbfC family nucleoid-associated protein [Dethiobacter sp.]MBS3982589.1 YbaB/EbfC family nucleoid-associated protein [Dethiobacter sp.]MCL4463381.1 YbaB/EbfC family nucleoid-associated protein [Bacillota bacterium]MCL5994150.1 YbaB/EbfC family nucleoid-associated protein [Bacillota bacterium]